MQGKSPLIHGVKKNGNTPYPKKRKRKRKRKEKHEKGSYEIMYTRNGISKKSMELNNRMTYEN